MYRKHVSGKELLAFLQVCHLFFCLVCTGVTAAEVSACNTVIGADKLGNTANNVDKHQRHINIVTDDIYTVKCCGVVESWHFTAGNTGQINLQIWQPLKAADKLKLVGQNIYDVQSSEKDKTVTLDITEPKERIAIRSGDYIGWFTEGRDIVAYKEEQRGKTKSISVRDFKVGDVVDFVAAKVADNRTYAINIKAAPGQSPSFVGLPTKTEISIDTAVGKAVYQVEAFDPDLEHAGALKIEMVNGHNFFSFDSNTNQVKVKSKLQIQPPSEMFKVDLKVTDPCGLMGGGTIDILVKSSDSQTTTGRSRTVDNNKVRTTPSFTTTTTTNPMVPNGYDDYDNEKDTNTATKGTKEPGSEPEPELTTLKSGTGDWIIGVSMVGVTVVGVAAGLAVYETTKYLRSRRGTGPFPKYRGRDLKGDIEKQGSGRPPAQTKLNTNHIEARDGDVKPEHVINDSKPGKLDESDVKPGKHTGIENKQGQQEASNAEPDKQGQTDAKPEQGATKDIKPEKQVANNANPEREGQNFSKPDEPTAKDTKSAKPATSDSAPEKQGGIARK